MALAESIFAKLSTAAAVTAIVGASTAAKVYPGIAPDAVVTPYVVWQEIAGRPYTTHDSASTAGSRLIQFSCVADTYAGALALGTAIRAALDSVALAGGELCTQASEMDGFSEDTDQYLRIVEATFFAPPG